MSEAQEQAAVIEWCDWHHVPVFHIPNGGRRDPKGAAILARTGVRAGVPDLFVPVARGGKHGLFVEMKAATGGRTSPKQREWLALLAAEGYGAIVAHGAREAQDAIESYLANS